MSDLASTADVPNAVVIFALGPEADMTRSGFAQSLGKEWVWRPFCTTLLNDLQHCGKVLLRYVQPELFAHHTAILVITIQCPPLRTPIGIPHDSAGVEHRNAGSVRSRMGGNHVTVVRGIGVRARKPVRDFVFAVVTGDKELRDRREPIHFRASIAK
ncbi:hypothetical protein XH97_34265 [Bradyrhizobium sp. CCBAU 53380]|nr:hypothetical protein [Bradyrhizobium sp. CCBAU 53380]